jgi:hypothetical protein
MVTSNIKVIRALWGNFDFYKNEIPLFPLYNETVYVWGTENLNKLNQLGYDTIFMGEDVDIPRHAFHLKLESLIKGQDDFDEIIFMDWDIKQIKELDDVFYTQLREKEFSMPTYSYPIEFINLKLEYEWAKSIIADFKKYGWRYNEYIVIPNAGFIYSNKSNIPYELNRISKENKISTLTEEFSMWNFANCSLTDYITKYEPKCIYGRPTNTIFQLENIKNKSEIELHTLINSLMDKNIYFIHE